MLNIAHNQESNEDQSMEECTTIKCSLPGKLNPENANVIRPLIEFYVEHSNKISHLGSLVANKYLMERCRLNLEIPRLYSVFFRKCVHVNSKTPTKSIDGLVELHDKSFHEFPKLELKTRAQV